jgi:hypothetical protein
MHWSAFCGHLVTQRLACGWNIEQATALNVSTHVNKLISQLLISVRPSMGGSSKQLLFESA